MKKVSWLGIFLIILGIILLASELGYLNIKWYDLIRFWPIIFVFWGLDILIGEKRWFTWVVVLLIVLFFSMIVFFSPMGYRRHKGIYKDWYVPYDPNIKRVELSLKFGARNIDLKGVDNKDLIHLSSFSEFDVKERKNIKDQNMQLNLEVEDDVKWFFNFGEQKEVLEIFLNPQAEYDLNIEGGIGNSKLDFRGLKLNTVEIEGGVGNISIWFPKSSLKAKVKGGVGNIKIYIPEGVVLDVKSRSGIGKVSIDSEISQFSEVKEGKIITLEVESGIGNIDIEQVKELI